MPADRHRGLQHCSASPALYRIDTATLELLGTVCLSLFLAMALMALKLWELVGLALPVLGILVVQTLS